MTESRPSQVRIATPRDEPALLDLLIALHRHNNYGWGHPYHEETIKTRIESGTRGMIGAPRSNPTDQRRGIIGVIGPEGERLVGSVGLFFENFFWFSQAYSLVEIWFFIRPEARTRQHHRDLFKFTRWAHDRAKTDWPENGPPLALMTGFLWDDTARQQTAFERMRQLWRRASGAREFGALFWRR